MLLALRNAGVDLDAAARDLGILDPAGSIPPRLAEALLDRALEQIVDPAFGLIAGSHMMPDAVSVIGCAAMSAPTFGEGLSRIARYKAMCAPTTLTLVRQGSEVAVQVTLERPSKRAMRMRIDSELAFLLNFGRRMTQVPISPTRVSIREPAPSYQDTYATTFGCPVRFAQPVDEVVFSVVDLGRPQVICEPELADLFHERAEQLLAESGRDDIVDHVRAALRRLLRGEAPAIALVAKALGQSERSLQRRLTEAGASFKDILDEVRREIARDRLARTDIEVNELAFLLGFSTPNSLHRAFKRWEQMTPLSFRRLARTSQV